MARSGWLMALAFVVAGSATAVSAQSWERSNDGWCDENWGGRDQERSCMVLSASIADPGMLSVDGGANGGVSVEGWSGSGVEVEAKVWANARNESRAEELAEAVSIVARGGNLRADGPDTGRRESWGVSWVIKVPFSTDLDIETHNGGINVADVTGSIRFDALNGGVHLDGVGGDVEGTTTNGGLHVTLDGDNWDGQGLDDETTTGGVTVEVPAGYSAQLETGTVNGGINVDFPVTVRGRIGKSLDVRLGEGGATVRAVTTNGGVKIIRSGSTPTR
jgi:hypothetical protein